jgi:hypothetical protein
VTWCSDVKSDSPTTSAARRSRPARANGYLSLDGTSYEIDLTAKNASVLRKALRPYIEAGRPIQGSRRRRPVRTKVGADARTVMAWARANGYQVRERGRVPKMRSWLRLKRPTDAWPGSFGRS